MFMSGPKKFVDITTFAGYPTPNLPKLCPNRFTLGKVILKNIFYIFPIVSCKLITFVIFQETMSLGSIWLTFFILLEVDKLME